MRRWRSIHRKARPRRQTIRQATPVAKHPPNSTTAATHPPRPTVHHLQTLVDITIGRQSIRHDHDQGNQDDSMENEAMQVRRMSHRSGDQPWGHRGRGKQMMPQRRETRSEAVAIIGLQAGKGFRLSPTPEVRAPPQQRRPTRSSADVMEPQKVAGTTPKGGDQCSESKGGTHQQQHGDEGER